MEQPSVQLAWRTLSLEWLVGPIFNKELRVSSRRRRSYVLRFVYVVLLTVFLALIWTWEVQPVRGSPLYVSSRMAKAGQNIVMYITWFQFVAAQVVAVVLMSTSISDEIYNQTLGILMVTPISAVQIVAGKLFSKLLQVLLLSAVSLPVLAVVRVLGGVSWEYVVASLCITVSTAIFVGAVSLLFSAFSRRAYIVIAVVVPTLGLFFGALFLATMFAYDTHREVLSIVTSHLNPYLMLVFIHDVMFQAVPYMAPTVSWSAHCWVMLGLSALVLGASTVLVRRVALVQAVGRGGILWQVWQAGRQKVRKRTVCAELLRSQSPIRRVRGPAVVWKEMVTRISSRERLIAMLIIGSELVMIGVVYLFPVVAAVVGYDIDFVHVVYVTVFLGIGLTVSAMLAAACITAEKESRCWPLLLCTPVSDWQIVLGKSAGVLRKLIPVWFVLFVYVVLFWSVRWFEWVALPYTIIIVAGAVAFLCGTGLYLSVLLRRTGPAVLANFALAVVIWGILPFLSLAVTEIFRTSRRVAATYWNSIPFVQIAAVIGAASRGLPHCGWPDRIRTLAESTRLLLLFLLTHVLIGLFFAWRAKCRLRRNVF